MSKIVIALGGNALGNTPEEQKKLIEQTVIPIVDLIEDGHQIVIVHGNGPQVGMINLGMNTAADMNVIKADIPFPECGAMSQGYIGYHLQNGLQAEIYKRKLERYVSTIVTQVMVDPNDPAFTHPTKPIGAFYSKEDAERLTETKGFVMKEDAGRGWRRVVASPKPVDIVEIDPVRTLLDNGQIVITCGGGGIPVIDDGAKLVGVPAVIDKDASAAKLAEQLGADILIILTAVEYVAINFGRPDQKELEHITVAEAKRYCAEGQFAPGSMLPKVEAAVAFVQQHSGRKAIIAALEKADSAVRGESGTTITAN